MTIINQAEQKNYLNEMNDAITDLRFYLVNQTFLIDLNQRDVAKLGQRFEEIGRLIQQTAQKQAQRK